MAYFDWLISVVFSMYMIRHSIGGTANAPKMAFEVVGSTGNIYRTTIGKVATCDCPDVRFRKVQCKHICFGKSQPCSADTYMYLLYSVQPNYHSLYFANILLSSICNGCHWGIEVPAGILAIRESLQTPIKHHSVYISLTQLRDAQELREMLAAFSLKRILDTTTLASTGERKPIEGGCPICFHDFETNKKTTWCQSCGSNFHEACFKKWERTLNAYHDVVHCLYW